MTDDEKQEFANEAAKCSEHPIVDRAFEEAITNFTGAGVPNVLVVYQLSKLANAVSQVARAQALGIDPNELR